MTPEKKESVFAHEDPIFYEGNCQASFTFSKYLKTKGRIFFFLNQLAVQLAIKMLVNY